MFYNNHYLCRRKQIILTTMPHFLPAIFAFLFWGKTTAESEDRTRHSSWMRTLIFLVLTICVGLIYVKTLEILNLSNYIDVRAVQTSSPQDESNQDSIQILISTRIDNERDEQATQISKNIFNNEDEDAPNWSSPHSKYSSSKIFFNLSNDTSVQLYNYIVERTTCDTLSDVQWNHVLTYPGSKGFSKIFNIDSLCTLIPEDGDQKYFTVIYQRSVPDFLLFQLNIPGRFQNSEYSRGTGSHTWETNWLSVNPDDFFGGEGVVSFKGISNKRNGSSTYTRGGGNAYYGRFNNLNYFTAGDISQAVYQLQLHSDIKVKEILVRFNTPVELVQLPFKPDEISPYGFSVNDTTTIRQLLDKNIRLYMKFPSLANKQLVRSLILTTLLTAVASLFLSNLYFCLRHLIRTRLGKEEKNPKLSKRLRTARMLHNGLLGLLLCLLLFYTIEIYRGNYIYTSPSVYYWGWVITIAAVALFFAIEYLLYRYAKSEIPTSPSDTD